MATAAENDEKMSGAATLAGKRTPRVCGGQDVEEPKLLP